MFGDLDYCAFASRLTLAHTTLKPKARRREEEGRQTLSTRAVPTDPAPTQQPSDPSLPLPSLAFPSLPLPHRSDKADSLTHSLTPLPYIRPVTANVYPRPQHVDNARSQRDDGFHTCKVHAVSTVIVLISLLSATECIRVRTYGIVLACELQAIGMRVLCFASWDMGFVVARGIFRCVEMFCVCLSVGFERAGLCCYLGSLIVSRCGEGCLVEWVRLRCARCACPGYFLRVAYSWEQSAW